VILPKTFPQYNGYLTFNQGLNTFARSCGEFAEGKIDDFTYPSTFYSAVGEQKLDKLLRRSNKEVKIRLDAGAEVMDRKTISPTRIENYYACPYKAFLSGALNLKTRAQGNVDGFSIGNVMHEIFCDYAQKIDNVTDKQSSDARFESITEKVLSRDEYKKFLSDPATDATVKRVLLECKEYCYKTYCSLKKSGFNKTRTEVGFGDGDKAEYPAIPLMDGKVRLKGKIDRVDEGDKYFRVLDYKTGKTDPSEKALFAGVKLQLYLYAAAVMKKYQGDQEKFPSGLYYLPVSDKYEKPEEKVVTLAVGKTLSEKEALITMDKEFFDNGQTDFSSVKVDAKGAVKNGVDRDMISACINYAVNMSEKAVKNMADGVIIASPFEGACKYCEYSSLCGLKDPPERKVNSCGKDVFIDALKGEAE
jgi:ATP-dependent helicase/nuclease subunit B